MRRFIKKINVLFLMLAGIAVIAHMIIPHDHHLSDSTTDNCPSSESNTRHNPGVPAHCHSLNDLTSEKVIKYISSEQLQCQDIIPGSFFEYSPVISETLSSLIAEFQNRMPDQIPITTFSDSAPPSFC